MKYTKKYKKKRSKTYKQRGGVRYEERPETIPHEVYRLNRDEEQYYYDIECFHKKVSKAVGDEKKQKAEEAKSREDAARRDRLSAIATDPNIEITRDEYERLIPYAQRGQWRISRTTGSQWNSYEFYKRIKPEDTLEWKAEHNPNIQLFNVQYKALSPRVKALGWVKTTNSRGEIYYRRRTAANNPAMVE